MRDDGRERDGNIAQGMRLHGKYSERTSGQSICSKPAVLAALALVGPIVTAM